MQQEKNKIYVTSKEMHKIDEITSRKYKISTLILMENAGKEVAAEVIKITKNKKDNIVVACGSGNNAGDGFVAARYLINAGYRVKILLTKPQKAFKNDCKANFDILKRLKAEITRNLNELNKADLIIDALLGTGVKGNPKGKIKSAIEYVNNARAKVIALDLPSGLNSDTGEAFESAVNADTTVTLSFLKKGFKNRFSKKYTGKIIIADIGIPNQALKDIKK